MDRVLLTSWLQDLILNYTQVPACLQIELFSGNIRFVSGNTVCELS